MGGTLVFGWNPSSWVGTHGWLETLVVGWLGTLVVGLETLALSGAYEYVCMLHPMYHSGRGAVVLVIHERITMTFLHERITMTVHRKSQ